MDRCGAGCWEIIAGRRSAASDRRCVPRLIGVIDTRSRALERKLLRWLSVFAGGFTVESARRSRGSLVEECALRRRWLLGLKRAASGASQGERAVASGYS